MPYTSHPRAPHIRMQAVKLVREGWGIRKVARHLGYSHSTVVRWVQKGKHSRKNTIPTESSKPHHHPRELPDATVAAILRCRRKHKRCAEVLQHLLRQEGILVSLSSIKRTLKRHGLLKEKSKWKKIHRSAERPLVASPGDLVQMDTIHIHAITGERFYIYTLLDVHSRWAYAKVDLRITTVHTVRFLREAARYAPFSFKMLQSDHGSEFGNYFTRKAGIQHRHSRVRKPNDNAHLERFNRTIQEECLAGEPETPEAYTKAIERYMPFYNNTRPHLALQCQTPTQVVRSY